MQSLIRSVDEELIGSWASITANLIVFVRSKGLIVYERHAYTLDAMADDEEGAMVPIIPTVTTLMAANTSAHTFLVDITQTEMDFATSLALSERLVEAPGRYFPLEAHAKPEPIMLPDLRLPTDYATTSCSHRCVIMKQLSTRGTAREHFGAESNNSLEI
jgi:hypothetical protein